MHPTIEQISILNLALVFIPVIIVVVILFRWSLNYHMALHAIARMLVQLILIGYVLTYIFESIHASLIMCVLAIMLFASSWIALRPIKENRQKLYIKALLSIAIGGVTTLFIVTQGVLTLHPWFLPRYLIPLGGMIFANSMNTVSLAAERFSAEMRHKGSYQEARRTAFRASLIPLTNSLFAVGLVSFPGMMTGQILSGVSPLIAARYQIMVMGMIFGSSGIASACYLTLIKSQASDFIKR